MLLSLRSLYLLAITLALAHQAFGMAKMSCSECNGAIAEVQKFLNGPSINDVTVKQLLGKACDLLPPRGSPYCHMLLDLFDELLKYWLGLARQYFNGTERCVQLGICPVPQLNHP